MAPKILKTALSSRADGPFQTSMLPVFLHEIEVECFGMIAHQTAQPITNNNFNGRPTYIEQRVIKVTDFARKHCCLVLTRVQIELY